MAKTFDPREAGFNAAEFRDAIRFAMTMGLPEDEQERVTFRWTPEKTYDVADPAGRPYSWTADPDTVVDRDDVRVPASIKFNSRGSAGMDGTPVGEIESSHIEVQLLDEDYALVEGADQILLDGSTYLVKYVKPPEGLFEVTTYTIFAVAEDEA